MCVLNALVGERFIQPDECRRADHIGVQDDSEFTCRLFSHEEAVLLEFQGQPWWIVT
jgi:hypothetical protein